MTASGGAKGLVDAPLDLTRSPLVRVLSQVRWPELGGFDLDAVAADVGRGLAADFPLLSKQREVQVILSPEGVREQNAGEIHRFTSVDEAWTATLGKTFIALESREYTGHDDFLSRLGSVLEVLEDAARIPKWSRIGYRYTNRLTGKEDLDNLETYFEPSVLGGLPVASDTYSLQHSITESLYRVDDAMLLVRSARLGPKGSIDPTLPPVDEDSWLLDLDAFDEAKSTEFTRDAIVGRAGQLAHLANAHFRLVIREAFVERFK